MLTYVVHPPGSYSPHSPTAKSDKATILVDEKDNLFSCRTWEQSPIRHQCAVDGFFEANDNLAGSILSRLDSVLQTAWDGEDVTLLLHGAWANDAAKSVAVVKDLCESITVNMLNGAQERAVPQLYDVSLSSTLVTVTEKGHVRDGLIPLGMAYSALTNSPSGSSCTTPTSGPSRRRSSSATPLRKDAKRKQSTFVQTPTQTHFSAVQLPTGTQLHLFDGTSFGESYSVDHGASLIDGGAARRPMMSEFPKGSGRHGVRPITVLSVTEKDPLMLALDPVFEHWEENPTEAIIFALHLKQSCKIASSKCSRIQVVLTDQSVELPAQTLKHLHRAEIPYVEKSWATFPLYQLLLSSRCKGAKLSHLALFERVGAESGNEALSVLAAAKEDHVEIILDRATNDIVVVTQNFVHQRAKFQEDVGALGTVVSDLQAKSSNQDTLIESLTITAASGGAAFAPKASRAAQKVVSGEVGTGLTLSAMADDFGESSSSEGGGGGPGRFGFDEGDGRKEVLMQILALEDHRLNHVVATKKEQTALATKLKQANEEWRKVSDAGMEVRSEIEKLRKAIGNIEYDAACAQVKNEQAFQNDLGMLEQSSMKTRPPTASFFFTERSQSRGSSGSRSRMGSAGLTRNLGGRRAVSQTGQYPPTPTIGGLSPVRRKRPQSSLSALSVDVPGSLSPPVSPSRLSTPLFQPRTTVETSQDQLVLLNNRRVELREKIAAAEEETHRLQLQIDRETHASEKVTLEYRSWLACLLDYTLRAEDVRHAYLKNKGIAHAFGPSWLPRIDPSARANGLVNRSWRDACREYKDSLCPTEYQPGEVQRNKITFFDPRDLHGKSNETHRTERLSSKAVPLATAARAMSPTRPSSASSPGVSFSSPTRSGAAVDWGEEPEELSASLKRRQTAALQLDRSLVESRRTFKAKHDVIKSENERRRELQKAVDGLPRSSKVNVLI